MGILRSSPWLVLVAGCSTHAPAPSQVTPQAQLQQAATPYPPSVLSGAAELVCNIDTRKNGLQKLTLTEGGGLDFEAAVSPILDGTVHLEGPEKGGIYKFTSHLAKPTVGHLTGVGDVDITQLETKVTVALTRYQQPGGPGTPLTFTSTDMSKRGIYVEFAGLAAARGGAERYAFRINLGAARAGSGRVEPRDSHNDTPIMAKAVMIEAPTTTVVSVTTSLRRVP